MARFDKGNIYIFYQAEDGEQVEVDLYLNEWQKQQVINQLRRSDEEREP